MPDGAARPLPAYLDRKPLFWHIIEVDRLGSYAMKDLSLVIPLYNESGSIDSLNRELRRFVETASCLSFEVLFVDDGSTDATFSLLGELKGELLDAYPDAGMTIDILQLEENVGKGGALKSGVLACSGRWILTLDADMATKATQVLDWEKQGLIDIRSSSSNCNTVYIGSREHPRAVVEDRSHRRILGRCFNSLVQVIGSVYVKDTQCGFKLYPRHLARKCFFNLHDLGWSHDVEVLARIQRRGHTITSLPVQWQAVFPSNVDPARDALRIFLSLFRIRLELYFYDTLGRGRARPSVRDSAMRTRVFYERLFFALFMALALLVLFTFQDYGMARDEKFHNAYGTRVLEYYTSLFRDRDVLLCVDLRHQGGLFDGFVALTNRFSPFGEPETRHLINALTGLLGILGCFRLARLLGGSRAGFWSALLLALAGPYWGQMFFNPRDIPFAVGHIWSLYYMAQWIQYLPRAPDGLIIKLGLAIGLTLGIRVDGMILLVYLGVMLAAHYVTCFYRESTQPSVHLTDGPRQPLKAAFRCCVLAYCIMLACWPWAQQAPLLNPFVALGESVRHHWLDPVLFEGRFAWAHEIPPHYALKFLLLKLPEIVLVFFLLGLILCTVSLWTEKGEDNRELTRGTWALVLLAFLFPITCAPYGEPALYNATRQVFSLMPLMACVAGMAISAIGHRCYVKSGIIGTLFLLSVSVYLVLHVGSIIRLHPYEHVYYNGLVGGLPGAQARYESDYWGTCVKESVEDLVSQLEKEADHFRQSRHRIHAPLHGASCAYYFPENFEYTKDRGAADFFIGVARWDQAKRAPDAPDILAVKRSGVPLGIVKDLRKSH